MYYIPAMLLIQKCIYLLFEYSQFIMQLHYCNVCFYQTAVCEEECTYTKGSVRCQPAHDDTRVACADTHIRQCYNQRYARYDAHVSTVQRTCKEFAYSVQKA
jgi:hypothetical protein